MSWYADRAEELLNGEHRQQGDELAAIAYAVLAVFDRLPTPPEDAS